MQLYVAGSRDKTGSKAEQRLVRPWPAVSGPQGRARAQGRIGNGKRPSGKGRSARLVRDGQFHSRVGVFVLDLRAVYSKRQGRMR
eukprot:2742333-Pleurochrysis_carterae.AAC.1